MNEQEKKETKEARKMLSKIIFECTICHKVFPKPGICQKCDIVLKAKAS